MFSLLSSRPGRPPKRGVPFPPMSPQDAMMHLKNMHNGANAGGVADPYKADGSPFPKGKDYHPYKNQFLMMNALFNNFKCTTKQDIVVCSWKNEIIHLSEPFLLSGDDDVALNFEALAHLKKWTTVTEIKNSKRYFLSKNAKIDSFSWLILSLKWKQLYAKYSFFVCHLQCNVEK